MNSDTTENVSIATPADPADPTKGGVKDQTTNANKVDGAPMPDAAPDSSTATSSDTGITVSTSAENVNPADKANDPQQMTSHAENAPDFVEPASGINVDSLNEAATVPITSTGANAAQHGQPDSKAFVYRIAAWFANIAHKLSDEEKRELVKFKAGMAAKYDKLLDGEGTDVQAGSKKLENEAGVYADDLKKKYGAQ